VLFAHKLCFLAELTMMETARQIVMMKSAQMLMSVSLRVSTLVAKRIQVAWVWMAFAVQLKKANTSTAAVTACHR
jgi:hypothetical protein